MDEFDGKTAVITGAAGGVGYETATMLVADGADVHIIDLLDPPALPEGPGRATYHQGDVTDWDFVSGVFDGLKRLDCLVNAAGVLWFGKDVRSIQCLRGDPAPQDAYQASKAGVIALTKSIAIQYAGDGIRANSVLPGGAWTPLQERWDRDPEAAKRAAEAVPLGRVGRAEDIANAIVFLLSDKASWITGTDLIVDGGLTALP
jgi:3-oxoacyl-[acyl-carrier protein] reductase